MKLHELKNTPGAKHRRKRVGRGDSSGWGKSAGRGEKGQKSRSGSARRLHFEGGQIPLFRRLPKRGFKSINHKIYTIVNVSALENAFQKDEIITPEKLLENKIIQKIHSNGVKILGSGEITKPLIVKANLFSKTAKEKIEAVGGKCETI